MPRRWALLSDWLGYAGWGVTMFCLIVWTYKFGWMKQERRTPEPEKGWVHPISGGGYGTYQESLESEYWFLGLPGGFLLGAAALGIRMRKDPNWKFRNNG